MSFYEEAAEDYVVLEYEPGNCPVCGTSGGNCKGDSSKHDQIRFVPPAPAEDPFATFTVPERVYETYQEGSRTVKKLKYPKGARIRPEEAKRLGLIP